MSIRRTGNEDSSSSSKNAASLDFVLSIALQKSQSQVKEYVKH